MRVRGIEELPELPPSIVGAPDGYAQIARLRAEHPFVLGPMGVILSLRHRNVERLVSDATRQVETEPKLLQGIHDGPIFDFVANAMLMANGEVHQRRRKPVARAFAFKLMEAMRPRAAAVAEELVAPRIGAGETDFLAEIATELPARLIAEVLGIPKSDLPVFRGWIADTAAALGFIDLDRRAQIEASLTDFNAYVRDLLADRRARPREDFLTDYVRATTEAGDLTEAEIRTQVVGLILAGSDTTRGSLCMILSQALQHPAQWADFCADSEGLARRLVDEGMRLEPIVSLIPRVALTDLEVDGWLLPAGRVIGVSIISALRDPEVFDHPDRFDLHRADLPRWHLVFGAGAHRCLGEALARAEMEEALKVIAQRAPNTRLVGPPPRLSPGAIRLIDQMRVAFA